MMLAACLAANGAPVPGESRSGNGTGQPAPDPDVVLAHIADNPGLRSEQISGALGTDTGLLSPVLRELREQGSVSVDGKGRAMRYAIA